MNTQGYLKGTVEGYLKGLSERSIVPGGGSASALAAALGAGLNLMVMNYSIEPGGSGCAPQGFSPARERQQESLERLSMLVDEDCGVFQKLMEALSAKRDAQKEYIAAAEVPMEICRECAVSIKISVHLLEGANRKLITDVGCAAHVLKAAFSSARLNVEVNLKCIEDRSFVENTGKELETIKKEIDSASGKIEDGLGKRE